MPKVTIYTDGAAKGNPGKGGYGVVLLCPPFRKELSAGYRLTTNNRMELMAVIAGLEAMKFEGTEITVYSDSRYVVDSVEKGWVFNWEKKGFRDKKNPDLWRRFLKIYRKHDVRFVWVKGHASVPENERCDRLAVAAAESRSLLEDSGYEPEVGTPTAEQQEALFRAGSRNADSGSHHCEGGTPEAIQRKTAPR